MCIMTVSKITEVVIYESPDGGRTVYSRQIGQSERTLVRQDPEYAAMVEKMRRELLWELIVDASKTNAQLRHMLEQVEIYYRLTSEDTSNNTI